MPSNRVHRGSTLLGAFIVALLLTVSQVFAASPDETLLTENSRTVPALPDVRRIAVLDPVGAGAFQLSLEASPEAISRAFLVYELAGVPHWTAAVRSINGLPALGGFSAVISSGTALQIEEINPRWLHAGLNQILFFPAPARERAPLSRLIDLERPDAFANSVLEDAVPYTVRNLRLVYFDGTAQPSPSLRLSYPVNEENDAAGTVLRGFVDPAGLPAGPAELFVDGVYLPQGINQKDGSFSVFVPRSAAVGEAWEVEIEVVYPDGTRLRRTVRLAGETRKDDDSEDTAELDADADSADSLNLDDAGLDLTPGALRRKVKLTMRGLRAEDLPAMDAGMTNVTPRARGFRLGPHGLRFDKPVRLRLPYDAALIPAGMTAEDIRTYYFDEEAGRWFPLQRVDAKKSVDTEGKELADANAGGNVIVSATDHFTDFVNATLALPEESAGVNHSPNSLQELAKPNPAAEIVQIAPPEGGPGGDAELEFPLVLPPGRLGMQPELAVRYSSGGGNGWLGVGWDLRLPSIEISTAFGVPRYDGTERYLIDGEQLVATSSPGVYVRRIEGKFDRIVRQCSTPSDCSWVVTDKNGTRFFYGKTAQARLRDPESGNTFRWYLEQTIDLHGNSIDYGYFTDSGGGSGDDGQRWTEVYPASIDYTGVQGSGGYYHVTFTRDGGGRPDRLSSGRQGFKTYARYRLAKVDVMAGAVLVRRYDFTYRTGDFQKSLLDSIAVTGEGGAAVFYRHTFDYVPMAAGASANSYAGFAAQQAWTGLDGSNDFTSSARLGGGAHAFVGLGPPAGCQPHGGFQIGGSGTDTTQHVTFLDVNGDGKPDRLASNGVVDVNEYDPVADPDGTRPGTFGDADFEKTFGNGPLAPGLPIGHTSEWSLDLGFGIHNEVGIQARLSANWVWSHANDDHLISDVNGDMRPDLVSSEGRFSVRLNDGSLFKPPTSDGWEAFTGEGLSLTSPGEETEVMTNFRLSNPLRQLLLPYNGRVTLTGAVQKKENKGDGVDVAIYHNGAPIWSRRFEGDDVTSCMPGPGNSCTGGLTRDVNAGDSLYFLAGAVRDTDDDALLWTPVVSYDAGDPEARETYGAPTFVFDAGRDFALAGHRGGGWSAGANGTVRVSGSITKEETSSDVIVSIARKHAKDDEVIVFSRTFAAAEQASFDGFPAIVVAERDVLFLRVVSRTPLDPARVRWTPTVKYEGATTVTDSKGEITPVTLPDDVSIQPARVAMAVPLLLPFHEPTQSWAAPSTGEQSFLVACELKGTAATFYVQGVNRLLTARALPVPSPLFPLEVFELRLPVTAGEPLFFTLLADARFFPGMFGAPASLISPGTCSVKVKIKNDDIQVPVNVRSRLDEASSSLSGGHHGWYYGDWNGNIPFNPQGLVPPDNEDAKPDFVPGAPRWEGIKVGKKVFPVPVWTAGGFDVYLAAEGVKPSRKGANAAGVLDQASGIRSGGGLSVLRKSSSRTGGISAGGGFGVNADLSISKGSTDTQLDLIDMNGDRFPDQVSAFGVRFSTGSGFENLRSFPGLDTSVRGSEDINIGTAFGLGITFNKKGAGGKPKAVLNTMPSVGETLSLSHVRYDLNDVNGDGLPDRVRMDPGSGIVKVRLNLGYHFGAEETWTLPKLSSSHCNDTVDYVADKIAGITSLDTLNGLSFTRSSAVSAGLAIGPFGGGVSTTLSRTLVDLTDVNGDGLPDRMAKDEEDDFFRVQLNLGDHWAEEQKWYVPRWTTSIGDGYNPNGLFRCLDAVSFNGSFETNGSFGVPLCIPLVPPVPVVGLQIEISGQVFGTISSGAQLFLEDLDGDGLADHILKKSGDANVYVKRNQAGKVNLLKTVHGPLGSTVEISYVRRGNHADMPFSQWVLSTVTATDGRAGSAPSVTRYDYANDSFYDRAERENYGYAHVRITQPDQSTIDREFLNRSFYSRHMQTKEVVADAKSLYRVVNTTYQELPRAGLSRFPAMVRETTEFSEGVGKAEGSAPTTARDFVYDDEGNVQRTTDFKDLADNNDDLIAEITYRRDSTHLTRPETIVVKGRTREGKDQLLRKRIGEYNNAGDLTSLEQFLYGGRDPESGATYSGTKNAVWNWIHDELGNVVRAVDPTGFRSDITYEATRTHPREISDSFGYLTSFVYDLKYGQVAETIDQNGNSILRRFDGFGRLVKVIGPYDSESAPALSFEYRLGNPISSAVAHHKDATRSDTIDSSVFIDSLERVIQTKDDAELDQGSGTSTKSGMRVSGRVVFDGKGRVVSQGQPVFDQSAANQFVEVPAKNPTTYTYDTLDRTLKVVFPRGETSIRYLIGSLKGTPRLAAVRTDPEGRKTTFYRDLDEHVIGIQQTNKSGGTEKTLLTRYSYDALDQLLEVTDAKGNATRLEYDTLGRNVVLDSPDLGRTEYRFDPAGNLRSKITANLAAAGQQIRRFYTFHRLDRIDYPQSPDVVYIYGRPGAPFQRANRIVTVTDASGVEERFYGKLGETLQTVKTTTALNGSTPNGPYTTRFEFDDFERLLSVVYPDGEKLTYGYDAGGQVKSATGLLKGVRFDYLRHAGYDEFGEEVRTVLGNGVETRSTYDPASRFLAQVRMTGSGRDLQNVSFERDRSGTIKAMRNDVPVPAPSLYGGPTTQAFQYDDLVQLVGAQGTYRTGPDKTSTYNVALSYDDLGNTVAKNQLHQTGTGDKLSAEKKTSYNSAYSYGGRQPHAPTRIGERTFLYDLNGNQTGWTSDANGTRRTLTWNEENRLASVADNGQTTRFVYDSEGTRTNKAGPNGETTYVNRWFTVRNGAIASKHVFADDVRLATKVSPNANPASEKAYFTQAGHLGSAQFVTDELGAVYEHLEYFPSGEIWVDERSETQRTPYLFSGKELDEETGLSYFGHRYYDARQGQWISADPILDEMLDVEKLTKANLEGSPFALPGQIYGYVGNNPTNLTDPDGLAKFPGQIGVGGRHGHTSQYSQRRRVESNHFPASSSYVGTPYRNTSRRDMPAVTMARNDHVRTATWGYSIESQIYRDKQRRLLKKGDFAGAMKMDIKDMLRITRQAPVRQQQLKRGILAAIAHTYLNLKFITQKEAKSLFKYTKDQ